MILLKRFIHLLLLGLLTGCTQYIFQPMSLHYASPDIVNVKYENIYIETFDQLRLHGWKLHSEENTNGAILFFHGNAENISTHFGNVHWLTGHGYDVYLFDYRGYGKSEGFPYLDGIVADMDTMIAYVVNQIPADEKLVVMGHSLGGSLAIYGVANSRYRDRLKLMITVEAFNDYHDVAQDILSTSWLTWLFQWPLSFTVDNSYRPLESVGQVTPIPLVIMHSKHDEIIPFYHAEKLFAAANEPKKLQLVNSDHNHVFNAPENRQLLLDYLKKYR